MKIRRYYAEVFVEPEAYKTVSTLKRGASLTGRKVNGRASIFLGEARIGVIRGRKRPLVSALLEFEKESKALFYNMNEKEGVMLVRVKVSDEPYK